MKYSTLINKSQKWNRINKGYHNSNRYSVAADWASRQKNPKPYLGVLYNGMRRSSPYRSTIKSLYDMYP